MYSLTNFEVQRRPDLEYAVYYNPMSDVVHFGNNAKFSSMISLFKEKGVEIPRVAMNCWIYYTGAEWNDGKPLDGLVEQYISRYIEIYVLHGAELTNGNHTWYWGRGCKGLKEVFWVIDSNFCGETRFRDFEISLHSSIINAIDKDPWAGIFDLATSNLNYRGGYKWTGNSGVKFQYVTCCPPNTSDSTWDRRNSAMINDENRVFFRLFEKYPGYTTAPEDCGCYGRGLGLSGTVKMIEKHKKDLEERFVSSFEH